MRWIIIRETDRGVRYRGASGHLSVSRDGVPMFDTPSEALDHAHEGDVVVDEYWRPREEQE